MVKSFIVRLEHISSKKPESNYTYYTTVGALYICGYGERDLLFRYAPAFPIIVSNLG